VCTYNSQHVGATWTNELMRCATHLEQYKVRVATFKVSGH
jgi:hypothetical protein